MRNISNTAEVALELATIRELILTLGRLRSLRDPLCNASEDLEFTPPQIHTLIWLGHDGSLTMGELARRCGISEKTVTGVVDRMERDKYVARERDPNDRRVVRVHLAPRGQKAFKQIDGHVTRKMESILLRLGAEDRQALIRILRRLAETGAPPSPTETP